MPRAPTKLKTARPTLADIVDALGEIKAHKANLEEQESDLRQALIDSGTEEVEGRLFRATVSNSTVQRVDYPALINEIGVSPRTLRKFTIESPRTTVKVVSR